MLSVFTSGLLATYHSGNLLPVFTIAVTMAASRWRCFKADATLSVFLLTTEEGFMTLHRAQTQQCRVDVITLSRRSL